MKLDVVVSDPDDNKIVECAVVANADIVTGDKHLLKIGEYQDNARRGVSKKPPLGFAR